ncbi:fungal-specific transcription factor domain-containing protein [Kalaharituber pfeilii]|nr:fungal-specific transcription factor domain-containing protein [Kalaharituber pfeilii]
MYPASPVSPVMPEPKAEESGSSGNVGDINLNVCDNIKPKRSPSSTAAKSPRPTITTSGVSTKSRSNSPTVSPSRKRKHSPNSQSDSESSKRLSFGFPRSPTTKMNLDINDIGMPGRSSSTRSRTKVPTSERRRVPVACDSCRHRKIRCNGEHPCQNCVKNSYECHFPPVSAKIVVEENWVERLQGRCSALEQCLLEAIPDPEKRKEIAAHYGLRLMLSSASDRSDSEPTSAASGPGTSSSSSEHFGGYDAEVYSSFIGDSASLTFINKIRDLMRATAQHTPVLAQLPKQAPMFNPSEGFHPLRPQINTYQLDPIHSFISSTSNFSSQPPLSFPSADPYLLPTKQKVLSLVQRFINFLGCGTTSEAMTASGGIYHWFDAEKLARDIENFDTAIDVGMLNLGEQSRPVDYSVLCMINAVLALACQATAASGPSDVEEETIAGDAYFWKSFVPPRRTSTGDRSITSDPAFTPTSSHSAGDYNEAHPSYFTVTQFDTSSAAPSMVPNNTNYQPGMTFFARAKALMVNPSDAPSLITLKTLSMLSYFLLSANRWEASYLHIGLAVRLAVANGLHRAKSYASTNSPGILDQELRSKQREEEERKRTFWTIYILDRLVSCITGRPVMLSDEAIDTELPVNIEGLPSASGLRAHVQLSKIMGDIITNVYPIRRPRDSPQNQHHIIVQAIQRSQVELHAWHEALPAELKLVNGVARERGVLWLHSLYNELLMLTCRPNLLLALKRSTASLYTPTEALPVLPQYIYDHAAICSNAAANNLLLARQVQASGWVHASFMECSYIFNAGMTLALARLIPHPGTEWASSGRQSEEDIRYAIAFLSTLAKSGNHAASRYTKDLMDLNAAVTRLIEARELGSDLQALSGPNPAMTLAPATVVPGMISPLSYQQTLRDFELFSPEYRELLDPSWTS